MSDGVIDSTYTIIAVSDELVQNTYQVISSNTEFVSKLTEDDVRNLLGIFATIDSLGQYAKSTDLVGFINDTDLQTALLDYVKTGDAASFITQLELQAILNEYVRNENITNFVTLESANW